MLAWSAIVTEAFLRARGARGSQQVALNRIAENIVSNEEPLLRGRLRQKAIRKVAKRVRENIRRLHNRETFGELIFGRSKK